MSEPDFVHFSEMIRNHATASPEGIAVVDGDTRLSWQALNSLADRIAAALQRDGVRVGHAVAICGLNRWTYAALWIGINRAGAIVAPLAPSSAADALSKMLRDCGASLFFADGSVPPIAHEDGLRIAVDDERELERWMEPVGALPEPVHVEPDQTFNIIYSSGTTAEPKGIEQSHAMRWRQISALSGVVFRPESVSVIATPLYSNTTLVSFLPTLGNGGRVVLMSRFDTLEFLRLSERERATNVMLVPVQYTRLLSTPEFDSFDLSSYQMKFSTSAPLSAETKADIVRRWPGGFIEFYGLTEGGGSCMLPAHQFPNKLHTVGIPMPGHEIRLIDEAGNQVPRGEIGEVVGRSSSMMTGYRNRPEQTRESEWFDADGNRFIRTGDLGRFDSEGFLTLVGRRKDVIISGGFNIYPSDLEAVLLEHPDVRDASVIGAPSERWGETPVAFVVTNRELADTELESMRDWVNERLGKTQRLSAIRRIGELPRSPIGKVLKRDLREALNVS